MQLKVDWMLDPGIDNQLDNILNPTSESESDFSTFTPLPSEDIWKKFDWFDDNFFNSDCDLDAVLDEGLSLAQWLPSKYSREITNHDCMWAGHCVSEKHDKNIIQIKKEEDEVDCCQKQPARAIIPTSARSLLLPTPASVAGAVSNTPAAICSQKVVVKYEHQDELETVRPETPLSLSESEDDLDNLELKQAAELLVNTYGSNFIKELTSDIDDDFVLSAIASESVSIAPTEVTGQTCRTQQPQQQQIPRYFHNDSTFSDHCYHLTKNSKMDHLGVQTPSDSEEEIDVVSICREKKKPNSRSSSSGGALPTNPSLHDRQQLQLTVATAICKKDVKRQSARPVIVPTRFFYDDRTVDDSVTVSKRNKRRNSPFDDYREIKSVKRKRRQYSRHYKTAKQKKTKRRSRINGGTSYNGTTGSSDSEVDTTERRSLHNNMERQRRIDLRNAFEDLRKLIPETSDNSKAPKVLILSEGARYCRDLTVEDSELDQKRAELRRQQEMLRARVSQLRRSLATRY